MTQALCCGLKWALLAVQVCDQSCCAGRPQSTEPSRAKEAHPVCRQPHADRPVRPPLLRVRAIPAGFQSPGARSPQPLADPPGALLQEVRSGASLPAGSVQAAEGQGGCAALPWRCSRGDPMLPYCSSMPYSICNTLESSKACDRNLGAFRHLPSLYLTGSLQHHVCRINCIGKAALPTCNRQFALLMACPAALTDVFRRVACHAGNASRCHCRMGSPQSVNHQAHANSLYIVTKPP